MFNAPRSELWKKWTEPHLLLAPTLLAGMLFLLWAGPGAASLDGRLAAHRWCTEPPTGSD